MIPQGNPTQLYAARVCAGTTWELPPRPLSMLCRECRPVPACKSCPGRSGETSPNKKAMGLLRSMALIGLGIYGVAMRVDAGSSC